MGSKHENKSGSCVYGGVEYSDGALLCQGDKLMRCNDGEWVDTGTPCESGEEASEMQVIERGGWLSASKRGDCGGKTKTSVAFVQGDGSFAFPTITISQPEICLDYRIYGSGSVQGTYLTGAGGKYFIPATESKYSVNPGTYQHSFKGGVATGRENRAESIVGYD